MLGDYIKVFKIKTIKSIRVDQRKVRILIVYWSFKLLKLNDKI
jgi:hypothetical protein